MEISELIFTDDLRLLQKQEIPLPPITEEEMHQSDNFYIPITASTKPKKYKATSEQEGMSWQTLYLNPWQFIEKLKQNYIYCGSIFKPFTQSQPEKGYKKYDFSGHHGFAGKFTSYFHLFSSSIISIDIDAFPTILSIQEVYDSLRRYNCHPTFLYTTSSDKTDKKSRKRDSSLRHFRMLYWFDTPIFASPIFPVFEGKRRTTVYYEPTTETDNPLSNKQQEIESWEGCYIWDEKENSKARRVANSNYSYICHQIIRNISDANCNLSNFIDYSSSYKSIQRYNGNPKSNFEVVGDFHILHTDDFICEEDNQPFEPIENFKTKEYIEKIKIPREIEIKKAKEADKKIQHFLAFNQKTKENLPERVNGLSVFDSIKVNVESEQQRYNRLKEYELIIYNTLPPLVPENDHLILSSDELKGSDFIPNMFKSYSGNKDIELTNVQYLIDFSDKEKTLYSLFESYKSNYPNRWQTDQIDPFDSKRKYPDLGYKAIYHTLPWQYTPLKHHNSAMRIYAQSGVRRKDQMRLLAIGRKIINPEITFDNLLFNTMVDFLFLTNDYTREGVQDFITKSDIVKVVFSVWNADCNSKRWEYVKKKITRPPTKKASKKIKVCKLYNINLTDKENLELLTKEGICISFKTLRRYLKELNITKYNKEG